ncbi:hypothetical protein [Phytohabitans suffuscus]|nr:hypothetical protein [Phytohabitans suffuscus]
MNAFVAELVSGAVGVARPRIEGRPRSPAPPGTPPTSRCRTWRSARS